MLTGTFLVVYSSYCSLILPKFIVINSYTIAVRISKIPQSTAFRRTFQENSFLHHELLPRRVQFRWAIINDTSFIIHPSFYLIRSFSIIPKLVMAKRKLLKLHFPSCLYSIKYELQLRIVDLGISQKWLEWLFPKSFKLKKYIWNGEWKGLRR